MGLATGAVDMPVELTLYALVSFVVSMTQANTQAATQRVYLSASNGHAWSHGVETGGRHDGPPHLGCQA
jgi:hypothetical protein